MYDLSFSNKKLSLRDKLCNLNYLYIFLIIVLSFIGAVTLYSAANGSWEPWAIKHVIRFGFAFSIMIFLSLLDVKYYYKLSYLFYFGSLVLLIAVEVTGHIGMGAQRWINFGIFRIQPSELMKIGMVLFLARYFSSMTMQSIRSVRGVIIPTVMALIPVALIILQPDLGTGLMLLFTTTILLFVIGVQWWKFASVGVIIVALLPIAWNFLHEYQKNRVLTFLNPERDPLGAGYHIIQSKIAFGSGGIFGKGFLHGTQTHLNFLPEKHTDFIFTMFSEEFGMVGSVFIVLINMLVIAMGYMFAFKTKNYFAKLVIIGLNTNYFLYVFINIAMVMGLLPVVGVPLPLISYGGTVMFSIMVSFGIILCMYVNQNNNMNVDDD